MGHLCDLFSVLRRRKMSECQTEAEKKEEEEKNLKRKKLALKNDSIPAKKLCARNMIPISEEKNATLQVCGK